MGIILYQCPCATRGGTSARSNGGQAQPAGERMFVRISGRGSTGYARKDRNCNFLSFGLAHFFGKVATTAGPSEPAMIRVACPEGLVFLDEQSPTPPRLVRRRMRIVLICSLSSLSSRCASPSASLPASSSRPSWRHGFCSWLFSFDVAECIPSPH